MSLLMPWLSVTSSLRLRTQRLFLETPRRGHYAQWSGLREASRAHLEPFEPQWSHDELTFAAYNRRLVRYRRERLDRTGLAFFVLRASDRELVGGVTLSNVRRGVTQAGSVGYWTGMPFTRRGYASEALSAVLGYAFEDMELNRVEAACMPINRASIGVLERAGFRREGLARRYLRINGVWEDHLLLACLRGEALHGPVTCPDKTTSRLGAVDFSAEGVSSASRGEVETDVSRDPHRHATRPQDGLGKAASFHVGDASAQDSLA